jgi:hypothetical protein
LEEPLHEDGEILAGFGEDEGVLGVAPLQFEAGGEGGDPNLADGSVGSYDEFAGWVIEDDVKDAILFFGLEDAVFFGGKERLLESFQSLVRVGAKLCFFQHG